MGRTNCEARVDFHVVVDNSNSATAVGIDRSQVQESWVYKCKFQVYVEVDVAVTDVATNCACGMTYSRNHPPEDPNYQKAYSTEITQFSMVAFDTVRNLVVGVFPPETFDRMTPNANTTALLRNAASSNSQDYELVAKGYSGLIKNLGQDKFPSALDPDSPEYTINNVPAMCFTVEEEYVTSYKWPSPPYPHMQTSPNVWVTTCYPFYDFIGQSAKRSTDAPKQRYFFKEFLLFPIEADSYYQGGAWRPKPRYITSFYRNSNCDVLSGVASFDREFISQFDREKKYRLHGAFAWKRSYHKVHVIGGVPKKFSDPLEFSELGRTKVTWKENYSRDDKDHSFRRGVLAHALLGTPEVNGVPFVGASENLKLCNAVPSVWKTCDPLDGSGCADLRTDYYNEQAYSFEVDLGATSDQFDCAPAVFLCAEETTFLSFQNFGVLARDYSKRKGSVLLTGPRMQFCIDYPTRGVFDSLYFRPYRFGKAGAMQLRKRDAKQADNEVTNDNFQFNDDGEILQDGSTDVPDVMDVRMQPAAGSAKSDGTAGGDHPIDLFPEAYTVPVTLNPADSSYDGVEASVFDGTLAPCLEGSKGCTCRSVSGRPKCDAPLECNQAEFCEVPLCVPGQAGCPCSTDGSCSDSTLQCSSDNMCIFVSPCTPGDVGCSCMAENKCTGAELLCNGDNLCVPKDAKSCEDGTSGCRCNEEGACKSEGDTCDDLTNMCVAPTCETGSAGCACADGSMCQAGFECKNEACVQRTCPAGQPGCACLPKQECSNEGFACKSFKVDGSDDRCVAQGVNCGDQTARCIKFCGAGLVHKCPPCANQIPLCVGSGASSIVPSALVAVIFALALLL